MHSTFVQILGNIQDHQVHTRYISAITDIYYVYNRNKKYINQENLSVKKCSQKNAIHYLIMKKHSFSVSLICLVLTDIIIPNFPES